MNISHHPDDIISIFNNTFFATYNTRLVRGDDEPIYLPADEVTPYHRIIFAHGFYASALHEIAHWCVAGAERRLLEDFGYWYEPDGRDAMTQAEFERVEIRPQAYEWIFSVSAGLPFSVSCDNLNGDIEPDRLTFMRHVHQEVMSILKQGLPPRVAKLSQALRAFYQQPPLSIDSFIIT